MTRFVLGALLGLALAPAALAQTFTGDVSATDPTREGGSHYDAHTFTLREGQQVKVRMEGTGFDTYLIVKAPDGQTFENDDVGGSTSVSEVEFVAPKAGTYTLWASAFGESDAGPYTVTVTPGRVARIETTEGRLDPRDRQLPKGEAYDLVEKRMDGRTPFSVELVSYGFDGFLVLESPSGKMYRNDDDTSAGGGSRPGMGEDGGGQSVMRAALRNVEPEAGVWKVYVTTLAPDMYGAYDLRVLTFPN